jgi:hypothetical protein
MTATVREEMRAKILRYYEQIDSGQFPAELFTEDFQFYSAKYGVGRGMQMFMEFGASAGVKRISHRRDDMLFVIDGNHVAVEGTTEGITADDVEWRGGCTPAGRYASIFSFNDAGLIDRMHIYVDPDFAGSDKAGFRWTRGAAQEW